MNDSKFDTGEIKRNHHTQEELDYMNAESEADQAHCLLMKNLTHPIKLFKCMLRSFYAEANLINLVQGQND